MSNSSVAYTCTPRQARKFVVEAMDAGLVPFLQSSPGVGKSSIMEGISNDFSLELLDERLSTREPVDLSGFAMPNKEGTRARYMPLEDFIPLEKLDQIPAGKNGWFLFLDEFNSAPKSVQAAAYKLILDRKIGRHRVHPNVAIACAGNLASDRAITNSLSTAMQSRLIHLEMRVSFEEWLKDVAISKQYDPRVIGFLSQWPDKLMDFKPDHHEKTFCCPRTWEFVNKIVTKRNGDLDDESAILIGGTITSGVALELIQFCKVYKELVTIYDIQKDPGNCRIPTENAIKWATITHMMEKVDNKNFKDLSTYADRFDFSFRVLFYRYAVTRKPELRSHPHFGPAVGAIVHYLND